MNFSAHELYFGDSQETKASWFEVMSNDHGLHCELDPQLSLGSTVSGCSLGDMRIAQADLRTQTLSPLGEEAASWQGGWIYVKRVTAGSLFVEQDGLQQRFDVGSFFIIDPSRPYREHIPERSKLTALRIPKAKLQSRGYRNPASSVSSPDLSSPDVKATRDLIHCIIQQSYAPCESLRALLGEQLLDLVGHTLMTQSTPANTRHPLTTLFRAKRYIQQNLSNDGLTIAQIADAVHVSGKHLQRLFQTDGMSLMRYVWQCRLNKAHRLLTDAAAQGTTVQEVAWLCGFANAAHFSRVFKHRHGLHRAISGVKAQRTRGSLIPGVRKMSHCSHKAHPYQILYITTRRR